MVPSENRYREEVKRCFATHRFVIIANCGGDQKMQTGLRQRQWRQFFNSHPLHFQTMTSSRLIAIRIATVDGRELLYSHREGPFVKIEFLHSPIIIFKALWLFQFHLTNSMGTGGRPKSFCH